MSILAKPVANRSGRKGVCNWKLRTLSTSNGRTIYEPPLILTEKEQKFDFVKSKITFGMLSKDWKIKKLRSSLVNAKYVQPKKIVFFMEEWSRIKVKKALTKQQTCHRTAGKN